MNNTEKSNYTKIRSVGAELLHAYGRTDGGRQTGITKVIVAFRKFAAAPTKS